MSISDLIKRIAEKQEISQKQARENYDVIVETVTEALEDKTVESLNLPGFVQFVKSHQDARTGRNPSTGESINIPAQTRLRAKPSKKLKDLVAGR